MVKFNIPQPIKEKKIKFDKRFLEHAWEEGIVLDAMIRKKLCEINNETHLEFHQSNRIIPYQSNFAQDRINRNYSGLKG